MATLVHDNGSVIEDVPDDRVGLLSSLGFRVHETRNPTPGAVDDVTDDGKDEGVEVDPEPADEPAETEKAPRRGRRK